MYKRVSVVKNVDVTDVTSSSVFQIGDSSHIHSRSRALAVQREVELFFGREGNFDAFPIFTMDIPRPILRKPTITRHNLSPFIKVDNVNIIGVAASSVFQIGSTKTIDNETRIKHIRQLLDRPDRQ